MAPFIGEPNWHSRTAIYFKGDWKQKFKTADTKTKPFYLASGKTVDVPLMFQKGDFRYGGVAGLEIIDLPYGRDKHLSMIVLLPDKQSDSSVQNAGEVRINGLVDLERKLSAKTLERWLATLETAEVAVLLPKFKMTSAFSLQSVLSAMGMGSAFTGAADFSGMSDRPLQIDSVLHQAYVDVNESGTEAAAATYVGLAFISAKINPVFRADRPFLFLIRDNRTGAILFLGRMLNPAAQ